MTTIVRRPRIQHAVDDATQALVYLEAARRALGPDPGDSFMDFPMLHPTSFLIAHAVEIGLGAFLRAEGKKGGLGNHDLRARLEAAEEAGFTPSAMFRKCVVAIDASHQSMQFRYSKDDQQPFVAPRGAIGLVAQDLERIRQHVLALALATPSASVVGVEEPPQQDDYPTERPVSDVFPRVQTFTAPGGEEMVIIAQAEFDALVDLASDAEEDAADAAIFAERMAALERGED